ncbi:sugar kinase [Streptomyces tanashiensis]|uniref:ROK family transcriptional regulator n=1 Tax=Streptomyces tanashiensis TaxID=67367 RepID=UPI001674FBF9|nr:ROK family protein [Streptomyces tanashiensis]GGT14705.1 sugar kinase [Streptomyces tanashiensis]
MTQLRFTQKGTKGSLRARNDVLVLQCVAAGGGRFARSDVIRSTGLPAATVSAIVADLIERRLVREAGREVQGVGKPRVLLELDDAHHRFLGVHLGRNGIHASRLTLTGRVEESAAVAHVPGEGTLSMVAEVARRLIPSGDGSVAAIGVAVPGIVGDDGVIREAVNYGWHMLPLGQSLSELCDGLPVHAVNDANAVALSEVALSADGSGAVVALWIGTGIGAGIVLDGRLYQGAGFRSGEIGHIDAGASLRCGCGLIGCLETVAAQPSIRGDADDATVERFLDGADDGEVRALGERVTRAARELARLLSTLAGTLDVTEFVLGGPMASDRLGPALVRQVNETLALRVMSGFAPLTLRPFTLGRHSVEFGAAAHAIRQQLGVMITMSAGGIAVGGIEASSSEAASTESAVAETT